MLDKYTCLKKLAVQRKDEVIITCMGTAKPWETLSDTPLDFASVDSAMGHAADFGLGIAMAQPDRRVIVLNGDGSMLMCLGTLVTIAQYPCFNYALVVIENGTYEVTGNQSVPGADMVDYSAIAQGAGIKKVYTATNEEEFESQLSRVFNEAGPAIFIWKVAPGHEGVPKFKDTIAERVEWLRQALA